MLNLNKLAEKNYKIVWFDGDEIELRRPSQRVYEQIFEIMELDEEDSDIKKIFNTINNLLYEIFKGNLSNKEITLDDIKDNFDIGTAYAVLEDFAKFYFPSLGE